MTDGPHMGAATDSSRADALDPAGAGSDADPSRGDPTLIGRLISGKYAIEKLLGGGAMGAVYKARFAALEKNVAVKVMHRAIAVDPSFVGRFHREAKAASRLDHPNSMRVIDFGEEPDGLLYIAMEYVEGRDLFRVIHEDWPISNSDLADMMMQALAALAVAHEMGVVHRDLKPENLMIVRAKNDDARDAYLVKVCDFGIAKLIESDDEPKPDGLPAARKLTTQGLVVGTPEYMSPEQAKGEKLDPRTDLYSMGVILYQLLTGQTPFTGDTALSVVLKHLTDTPVAPSVHYPGVHRGLEAVCMRALAKDREARWQSARDMRSAIREALEGRPLPVAGRADADTAVDPNLRAIGTDPAGARVVGTHESGPRMTVPIESAPTVAGVAPSPSGAVPGLAAPSSGSTGAVLGISSASSGSTATAPPSRALLVVGLLAGVVVLGGGTALLSRATRSSPSTLDRNGPSSTGDATSKMPAPTASSSAGTGNVKNPPAETGTSSLASAHDGHDKAGHHEKTEKNDRGGATGHTRPSASTSTATAVVTEPAPEPAIASGAPAASPTTTTDPANSPASTPPPPATAVAPTATAAPPPPPVFNAATCRATAGAPHATGATNAKDLVMTSTADAWTTCARASLRERPGSPIAGVVHLDFSDNGAFRGARATGVPAPLASCIAASTGRTVKLKIQGGDITGEPSFDVPVSFACE